MPAVNLVVLSEDDAVAVLLRTPPPLRRWRAQGRCL